jgi:catechol O-methyltransferase
MSALRDPFEAFVVGGDGEEDVDNAESEHHRYSRRESEGNVTGQRLRRDPEFGALTHHRGVEQALLQFVISRFEGEQLYSIDSRISTGGTIARCERILALIDEFCRTRHWMMHVGDEKGKVLEEFLGEKLRHSVCSTSLSPSLSPLPPSSASSTSSLFRILELGTYCGYSILRMAKTCLQQCPAFSLDNKIRIVSVDVSLEYSRIAERIVRMAGVQDMVRFVVVSDSDVVNDNADRGSQYQWVKEVSETLLHDAAEEGRDQDHDHPSSSLHFDFCFIDHEKDRYLPDLQAMERSRFVGPGTYVAADNVVFFQLSGYRAHVRELVDQGKAKTRLVLSRLEYTSAGPNQDFDAADPPTVDLRDGLGASAGQEMLWFVGCLSRLWLLWFRLTWTSLHFDALHSRLG